MSIDTSHPSPIIFPYDTMTNSRLPGFYKATSQQRRTLICKETNIKEEHLFDSNALTLERASIMVENTIGTFALPLATAVNFQCNGKDVLIPMVIEEPSVVASSFKYGKTHTKIWWFLPRATKVS